MEKHYGFEALNVIEMVSGAIVEFNLRHPELQWGDLTHDVRGERWIFIELGLKGMRGSKFEGL